MANSSQNPSTNISCRSGFWGDWLPVRRLPQSHWVRSLCCRVHLQAGLSETRVSIILTTITDQVHHNSQCLPCVLLVSFLPSPIEERFMNTPLMFHNLRSGLEAANALVGLASANPTRTPPSPQSLRTSLPTRSNWNNKLPCNSLCLSRKIFSF